MEQDRTRPFSSVIPDDAFEHARTAREEFRKGVAALLPALPAEFTRHRHAARKEILLAIRSVIDSAIERVEKIDPKAAESRSK
jgi:hypothetical protein